MLALAAVLVLTALPSAALGAEPTTVTFAAADGYDSKRSRTLVRGRKLHLVRRSDNRRVRVRARSWLSLRFAGSVPAGATILSARVAVEHHEQKRMRASAMRWQVGGGSLTSPTAVLTGSPARRVGRRAERTDRWDVGAAIDTPAEVNGLVFRVRNRATNGRKGLVDRVALIVRYAESTPTPAPPPPPATLLAAGDIADCNSTADEQTASLLDARPEGTVVTLGDNAYADGSASEYADCYAPTWGRHKARTRPSPGNHDYHTPGAAGYFGYFGAAAGPAGLGYYSFDLGAWHVVSLNSEQDLSASGAQLAWLRSDLAATRAGCVLAFFHRPRFTAGNYSDFTSMTPFWDALYAANAEVVLNGHDHVYERYTPMNPAGAADPARGIREFVVGTGGRHHYALQPDARREAGNTGTFGILQLTLHATSYDWQFLPVAGSTYSDSGSGSCH